MQRFFQKAVPHTRLPIFIIFLPVSPACLLLLHNLYKWDLLPIWQLFQLIKTRFLRQEEYYLFKNANTHLFPAISLLHSRFTKGLYVKIRQI